MRSTGYKDALGIRRDRTLPRLVCRLARDHGVLDLPGEVLDIEVERAGEHGAHELHTAHDGRLLGLELEHLELSLAQTVATAHGITQVVIGDRDAVKLLEALLEQHALPIPALTLVGAVAALRKMQDVRGLELV